jgi:hypothetical protein
MHWLDPDYLPEVSGTVKQFLVNPHGKIDGLIFKNGTELHFPPHLSGKISKLIAVGEKVKVRGVSTKFWQRELRTVGNCRLPKHVQSLFCAERLTTPLGRGLHCIGWRSGHPRSTHYFSIIWQNRSVSVMFPAHTKLSRNQNAPQSVNQGKPSRVNPL